MKRLHIYSYHLHHHLNGLSNHQLVRGLLKTLLNCLQSPLMGLQWCRISFSSQESSRDLQLGRGPYYFSAQNSPMASHLAHRRYPRPQGSSMCTTPTLVSSQLVDLNLPPISPFLTHKPSHLLFKTWGTSPPNACAVAASPPLGIWKPCPHLLQVPTQTVLPLWDFPVSLSSV